LWLRQRPSAGNTPPAARPTGSSTAAAAPAPKAAATPTRLGGRRQAPGRVLPLPAPNRAGPNPACNHPCRPSPGPPSPHPHPLGALGVLVVRKSSLFLLPAPSAFLALWRLEAPEKFRASKLPSPPPPLKGGVVTKKEASRHFLYASHGRTRT